MDDDGVLCELVEVGYGLDEDGGCGGDGGELPRANGLENREERVRILTDCKNLRIAGVSMIGVSIGVRKQYLWELLCDYALSFVLLERMQVL